MATYHFVVKELGQRLSDAELDELKPNCYDDVRGHQENLAESSTQLLLEAASAKQAPSQKVVSDVQQNQTVVKGYDDVHIASKNAEPHVDHSKKSGGLIGDGLSKANNGVVSNDDSQRASTLGGALGRNSDLRECSGVTAWAIVSESLVIEKVPASSGIDGNINVEQLGNSMTTGSLSASYATLSIRVFDKKSGADTSPLCLEARPREHVVNDIIGIGNMSMMREIEIACTRGPQTLCFSWKCKFLGSWV